jgi:ribosome-binding factor A
MARSSRLGRRGKALVAEDGEAAYLGAMSRASHPGSGPSPRQLRVGELIRRTLSDVLSRGDVHDPDLNRIPITVGEVVVSPDLKTATAYVLPLGGAGRDEMLEALRRNRTEIRRQVTRGMTLKFSPDLKFAIDETFDRLDDTRRMFADERVRRDLAGDDAD